MPIFQLQSPLIFRIGEEDRPRFRHEFERLFDRPRWQLAHPQTIVWIALRDLISLAGEPQIPPDECFSISDKEQSLSSNNDWYEFGADYGASNGYRSIAPMGLELRVDRALSVIELLNVVRYADAPSRDSRHLSAPMAIDIEPNWPDRYYSNADGVRLEPSRTAAEQAQLDFEARARGGVLRHPVFNISGPDDRTHADILQMLRQAGRIKSRPAACEGCANYHGETYGGNRLICAIHPHGVGEETSCGDFAAS